MRYPYRCLNKECPEHTEFDETFDMDVPVDLRDEQYCATCGEKLGRRIVVPMIAGVFGVDRVEKFDKFWRTGEPDDVPDRQDSAPVI